MSIAQYHITGKLTDQNGQGIQGTITFQKDTSKVTTTLSDTVGSYRIEQLKGGEYYIEFTSIGFYKIARSIKLQKDTTINIVFNRDTIVLKEVVVKGRKPLLEQKIDRTIFNVENSVYSKGVSTMDLLKQVPRIDVSDDGIISMIGKGNVRIMVNDRLLNGSYDDIVQKLKSLRSDNISSIEVIPIPPSKYSAEGNSGLINIILKKNPLLGWQGAINAEYNQRYYPSFGESGYVTYRSAKFVVSLNIGHNHSNILNDNDIYYTLPSNKLILSRSNHSVSNVRSVGANLEYAINKNLKMGGDVSIMFTKMKSNNFSNNQYFALNHYVADSTLTSSSNSTNNQNSLAVNTFLDYTFTNSKVKKISFAQNYFSNNPNSANSVGSNISVVGVDQNSLIQNLYNGSNRYKMNSFYLDVDFAFLFAKIESGLAYTSIDNKSALQTFQIRNGLLVVDSSNSNTFLYFEKTPAIYFSASKEIGKSLIIKTGLRYEFTSLLGSSQTLNLANKRNFGNLFPTVYLLKNFKNSRSISLSYGKRIERPYFNDLNPFKFYYGAYSYNSGNPYLLPTMSHNLELNYVYNRHLTILFYGTRMLEGASTISQYKEGINFSMPFNFFNQNRVGLNINGNYTFLPWWSVNSGVNAYYSNSKSYLEELKIPGVDGYGSFFRIQNTFFINKKRTSVFSVSYLQNFKSRNGFYETNGFGTLSANYRYTTNNNRWTFSLSGYDILNQRKIMRTMIYNSLNVKMVQYPRVQNLTVSVNYNFGNLNVKNSNREGKIQKERAN